MAGLVEEIQALSLDPTVSISDLLRRVKLAAVKLNLQDAVEWVDLELKGYAGIEDNDVPQYRYAHGRLMEVSQHWGTKPALGDPKTIAFLSFIILKESISSLAELSKSDGKLAMPVDADIQANIFKAVGGYNRSLHVEFDKSVPIAIMSRVRDLVLDWACALEKQGILGEGISFSMEEKKKAEQAAQSVTINYGHIHNGDTHGNQNKTVIASTDNSVNTITTENVFDQLIQAVDSSIGNENDREAILDLVKAMQATQGTADYKPLFQKWVGYLAEYATVLGPFLPTLSQIGA